MTLYGDVDVSIIDELPPGRKPIKTMVHGESKRLEVLGFVRREIDLGHQAYVIYPLVEESEKMDLLAVTKGHELMEKYFKPYRVGIVHGKMNAEAKEFEMQRFVKNETQVLVSTTVIEVGEFLEALVARLIPLEAEPAEMPFADHRTAVALEGFGDGERVPLVRILPALEHVGEGRADETDRRIGVFGGGGLAVVDVKTFRGRHLA